MVRKVISFVFVLVLIFAFGVTAQAATHSVYDGTMSSTYVSYFRDIVSGIRFNDNYVAFRSGQNEYTMIVGELEFSGSSFSLVSKGKEYRFSTDGNYNSTLKYYVNDIDNFSLSSSNYIVYSDLGDYPQLVERGAKYEILTTFLLSVALLCVVFGRFFSRRFR